MSFRRLTWRGEQLHTREFSQFKLIYMRYPLIIVPELNNTGIQIPHYIQFNLLLYDIVEFRSII